MNNIQEIARTQGGLNNTYRYLHTWVQRKLGTPQKCEICGTTEDRRYHWANKSGEYRRDLTDWRRLCVPCHMTEKNPGHCKHGHELSLDNLYTYPDGRNQCRTCRKGWR
jgi:hypothetical protein